MATGSRDKDGRKLPAGAFSLDTGGGAEPIAGSDLDGNSGDASIINPASISGAGGDGSASGDNGTAKRKRGRPAGSGSKSGTGAKTQSLDITGVETILLNIHTMLAAATQVPELAINTDEANQLAKAVANVQQYYPMHINPKTLAWSNLLMVAGSVYGSRAVAIWANMKAQENKQTQQNNTGSVTPLHRVP